MTTTTGIQLLPLYRDVTIEQVKRGRGHAYRVSSFNNDLPSITTILGIIDKSGPLVGWATKTAFASVEAVLQKYSTPIFTQAECDSVVEVAKAHAKDARNAPASKGSLAHEYIAKMLVGKNPIVPDEVAPAVRGAREFVADYNLTVEAVEMAVWHPMSQFAGTIDFVGRDPSGNLVVADWKRSKGIYPEHGYQVAAYADMLSILTGEPVAWAYVVRLPQEGGEDAGYECRKVFHRDIARSAYTAAHRLWAATKLGSEMWG